MRLLSLDPGIRGSGVALFNDGKLVACDYVKNPVKKGNDLEAIRSMALAVGRWTATDNLDVGALVCEYPQIYGPAFSKGDNNDLLALAGVGSALAALYPDVPVTTVLPREWKGQVPKETMHGRIRGRLDGSEADVWHAAEKRGGALFHNTADAVGIGLWHLGRLAPKKAWAP